MKAKTTKRQYNTVLSQEKKGVPRFLAYGKFIEKIILKVLASEGSCKNWDRRRLKSNLCAIGWFRTTIAEGASFV